MELYVDKIGANLNPAFYYGDERISGMMTLRGRPKQIKTAFASVEEAKDRLFVLLAIYG